MPTRTKAISATRVPCRASDIPYILGIHPPCSGIISGTVSSPVPSNLENAPCTGQRLTIESEAQASLDCIDSSFIHPNV